MDPPVPDMIRYLIEACRDMPWQVDMIDGFSHHLVQVSAGGRSVLAGAGGVTFWPLNGATAHTLSVDKAHTAEVLRRAGFRVPEGRAFFLTPEWRGHRPAGRELGDAVGYAEQLGYPVFVKPNAGARGAFAELVLDRTDLLHHLTAMARRYPMALIQPVQHGREYRLLLVEGEVRYAHRRLPAVLTGDGRHSVSELLDRLDQALVADGLSPVDRDSGRLRAALAAAGLGAESVPAAGQPVALAARANLSAGGGVADFTETVSAATAAWCRRLAAVLGLRVCGLDVFSDGDLEAPERLTVLEVNGNPSITALEKIGRSDLLFAILRQVFAKALES